THPAVRCLPLALLGCLGAAVALASAQEPARSGRKVALLVGVRDYERNDRFPNLQYTENDVEELAKILKAAGFEVRLLTSTRGKKDKNDSPTAANVRKALTKLLEKRQRDDLVVVALSGHGVELDVEDPRGKGRDKTFSYFCPA